VDLEEELYCGQAIPLTKNSHITTDDIILGKAWFLCPWLSMVVDMPIVEVYHDNF
jgi:hypothetical protein